jgi:hypothetical protein
LSLVRSLNSLESGEVAEKVVVSLCFSRKRQQNVKSLADIIAIVKRRRWCLLIPAVLIFSVAALAALLPRQKVIGLVMNRHEGEAKAYYPYR